MENKNALLKTITTTDYFNFNRLVFQEKRNYFLIIVELISVLRDNNEF